MLSKDSSRDLGCCPICLAAIPDRDIGGGIWTGSTASKASNGPLLAKTCPRCGAHLVATPTYEELEERKIVWEQESDDEKA